MILSKLVQIRTIDALIHLVVATIVLIVDGVVDRHLVAPQVAEAHDDEDEVDDEVVGNRFFHLSFAFNIQIFSISLL